MISGWEQALTDSNILFCELKMLFFLAACAKREYRTPDKIHQNNTFDNFLLRIEMYLGRELNS